VPKLLETIDYLANATGFHEFAEFTAQDIGTVDSGLNSMVLASNNERVILPVSKSPAVASGFLLQGFTRSFTVVR
jgi:4-hydroxyphenylpyruvate dioxygenase